MKVILLQDIPNTGQAGQIREVANGYARNYLIPKGIAAPANPEYLQKLTTIRQASAERRVREQADWEEVAKGIDGTTITLSARAGTEGRLFGSVTSSHIAQALSQATGHEVDRRGILLPRSIRDIGSFAVPVRLYQGVEVSITVSVEPLQE